jgi:enolase-phosphatase E1
VSNSTSAGAGTQDALHFSAEAVLLDIEGTISPISFVRDVLFPYSKDRLRAYLSDHRDSAAVQDILAQAAVLANCGDAIEALADWHERDIKAPPLKKLQGQIWESGYRSGALRSPLFADVLPTLTGWKACGLPLYIYSSGSVQAQLLFFEFNAQGDLRPLFSGYFDTEIGAKTEAASYLTIAAQIDREPGGVIFFSDNTLELAAARAAGLQTAHVVKDGTKENPDFPAVYDFGHVTIAPAKDRAA